MTIRVLVVDDSSFFRRRVTEILEQDPELRVVETAANGQEALDKLRHCRPDVITMDIEMPVMNGISAVRAIMQQQPVPVIMFSSLTYDGARATLEALEAGAADFLPKRFEDIASNRLEAARQLQQRVRALAEKPRYLRPQPATARAAGAQVGQSAGRRPLAQVGVPREGVCRETLAEKPVRKNVTVLPRRSGKHYQALLIGSSTGGPVALQQILTQLPADYPLPILLVQHMPATFTAAFAQRLNTLCRIKVKEAEAGELLAPGTAYLAPGGKQMLVEGRGNLKRVVIRSGDENLTYKPSVDLTFGSASQHFAGDVLGVILTGMGADGREGCRLLKAKGATIWAQDAASCVVYGMPQAVAKAGISSLSLPLDKIGEAILKETQG